VLAVPELNSGLFGLERLLALALGRMVAESVFYEQIGTGLVDQHYGAARATRRRPIPGTACTRSLPRGSS